MRFDSLPLADATLRALEAMGFEEMTPVQEQSIPTGLEGRDMIAQAQTGTGKTAAFGVPLVEAAAKGRRGLVLAPTRELAKQVQQELQAIGKGSPVDFVCLIGGAPFGPQAKALQRHPGAGIVATPGRVIDHLERGTLTLDDIAIFVLDEADEMMSMGFQDELDRIVDRLPEKRQTMLFTATLPPPIMKLAQKALHDPARVKVGTGKATNTVEQFYAEVAGRDRIEAVRRIVVAEEPRATLYFAKTRIRTQELADAMRNQQAEALHGGMQQSMRDAVMGRFRAGTTSILVATDVAARGLDVDEIDLVLHDEPPMDADTYVHRIGRTGRAGREGKSILFVSPGRLRRIGFLRRVAGELARYDVPSDAALESLRAERIVDELTLAEPGDAARDAMNRALEAGLDADQIAARALHLLATGAQAAAAEEQVEPDATVALSLKVGKIDRIQPGAIVGALCNAAGMRVEDIGRIDLIERMSVVEVPAADADRIIQALSHVRLSGRALAPRIADDWRFRTPPGSHGGQGSQSGYGGHTRPGAAGVPSRRR